MALTKITGEGVGAVDSLTVDTNTLLVDAANNRVGIGKTPAYTLDIHGVTAIKDSESLTWQGNAQLSSAIVGSGSGATLHFWTSANERMRIQSGGVVSFSTGIELGSALDGTAANTLEDYEEGTFTPTYSSGVTVTSYSIQSGHYTKIGNLVFCQIGVDPNVVASRTSDQWKIGGLPFPAANVANNFGGGFTSYTGGGFDKRTVTWRITPNNSTLDAYNENGNTFIGSNISDATAGINLIAIYQAAT